jgi:hypothetical protein
MKKYSMTQDEYLNRDHSGEYRASKWCLIICGIGLIVLVIKALI